MAELAKTETNPNWKALLTATEKILNPNIKTFTQRFLNEMTPDYFARIPASATGKYHPEDSLGYGGLVRHTLAAAAIGWDICGLQYLQFTHTDRDYIYAALLLHDTFKQGKTESGKTLRTHPNIAAHEILNFGKATDMEDVAKVIAGLVVSHMGEWGNQKPGNRGQFIVHLADFISSRRYIGTNWKDALDDRTQN